MKFCRECNNLLYPKEIKEKSILMFGCRNCEYVEKAEENNANNNCVYRNEVKLGQSKSVIDPSIINDPTYSRTKNTVCPKCGYTEAIYFQNNTSIDSDIGMKLVFVCCRKNNDKNDENTFCGNSWSNEK